MSSPRHGAQEPNEHYPTPDWAVGSLLEHWLPPEGLLYEPMVGDGAIVAGFRRRGCKNSWAGTDIVRYPFVENGEPEVFHQQSFDPRLPGNYTAVVTNPAFSLTLAAIKLFLDRDTREVNRPLVLLVRPTFLESKLRNEYLRWNMPNLVIQLPKRMKGPNGKTDTMSRQWLVWDRRYGNTKFVLARHPDV